MSNAEPIQNLDSIDIYGERKDGGVDMVIVASSRLIDTPRNQELLRQKVQAYTDAIFSDAWAAKYGESPYRIFIRTPEAPEQGIINLIGALKGYLAGYNVELFLEVSA